MQQPGLILYFSRQIKNQNIKFKMTKSPKVISFAIILNPALLPSLWMGTSEIGPLCHYLAYKVLVAIALNGSNNIN